MPQTVVLQQLQRRLGPFLLIKETDGSPNARSHGLDLDLDLDGIKLRTAPKSLESFYHIDRLTDDTGDVENKNRNYEFDDDRDSLFDDLIPRNHRGGGSTKMSKREKKVDEVINELAIVFVPPTFHLLFKFRVSPASTLVEIATSQ